MNSYFSRLDHLRFFAASWIVLYHFGGLSKSVSVSNIEEVLQSFAWMGASGVSLFLVLSGFLFCIISGGGDRKIEYSKFIKNRILRIFPLLVFIVFIVITVNRAESTPMDIFRVLTLQLNTGDPISGWGYSIFPIGQIWTIAVEFQFYLIFPFISLFLKKYGIKYILGSILLMELTKFSIIIIRGNEMNMNLYFTIIGRLDQILIGILFGVIYLKFKDYLYGKILYQISIFTLLTIVLGLIYYFFSNTQESIKYGIVFTLIEAVFFGAFILCYLTINIRIPHRIDVSLAWLGRLSYSMYLLHIIVGNTFLELININFPLIWIGLCIILPLVILISTLTYYVIEKPFLSMKVKYLG